MLIMRNAQLDVA